MYEHKEINQLYELDVVDKLNEFNVFLDEDDKNEPNEQHITQFFDDKFVLLYDGVMLSLIHTTMMQVKHDGACLLIHAMMLNEWRCLFIYAHNDGCEMWLIIIICQ